MPKDGSRSRSKRRHMKEETADRNGSPDKGKKKEPRSKERDDATEKLVTTRADADANQAMVNVVSDAEPLKTKKDRKTSKDDKKNSEKKDSSKEKKSKKRKREDTSPEEIEIDLSAPEPPSKKALRKLKKLGLAAPPPPPPPPPPNSSQARSKFGIWIGNLSWSTTPDTLKSFLSRSSESSDEDITRVNLPLDSTTTRNKGFAYVDFSSQEALGHALSLTESMLDGRRVLIKDSKDFSNRGTTASDPVAGAELALRAGKNPPSSILFVGNLDFDVTPEALQDHFAFAGKILKVRLATFQDSGKCKGYGWVDFEDVESVQRAMLGLSVEEEKDGKWKEIEGKEEARLYKRRRKRVLLGGRPIKMEFGEDAGVRYKKRFGNKIAKESSEDATTEESKVKSQKAPKPDMRSTDPGAAYSADSRRTGAITEAKGKKFTFDD